MWTEGARKSAEARRSVDGPRASSPVAASGLGPLPPGTTVYRVREDVIRFAPVAIVLGVAVIGVGFALDPYFSPVIVVVLAIYALALGAFASRPTSADRTPEEWPGSPEVPIRSEPMKNQLIVVVVVFACVAGVAVGLDQGGMAITAGLIALGQGVGGFYNARRIQRLEVELGAALYRPHLAFKHFAVPHAKRRFGLPTAAAQETPGGQSPGR